MKSDTMTSKEIRSRGHAALMRELGPVGYIRFLQLRRMVPSVVVELGSGSGDKLKALVDAGDLGSRRLNVHLVDLSAAALELSRQTLGSYRGLQVATYEATYEDGLGRAAGTFGSTDRVLALFLGSNIGNFDPPASEAFVRMIRRRLRTGDALLLGADLVKPAQRLELAYDDPLGVTAAFNRNLLVRVNRELNAHFAIDQFAHRAIWNEAESRVEMHLVARTDQVVRVEGLDLEFRMAAGETIWTESSYKFSPGAIRRLLDVSGFRPIAEWVDEHGQFLLTMAEAM